MGGHINAFKECLINLPNMNNRVAWAVYKNLVRYGHLHIIQWLEAGDQLQEPGGSSWKSDWKWRFFNEIADAHGQKADIVAIRYGQTHILDWASQKGWITSTSVTLLRSAIHENDSQIHPFKSMDWVLDHFLIELRMMRFFIPEALVEGYVGIAYHLFKRGLMLDENSVRRVAQISRGLVSQYKEDAIMAFQTFACIAENEPDKYIVEIMDGSRRVWMRHPSNAHYQE